MADRKRAASEEPTASTGTRKSARATAPVDVFKPSAFDVKKDTEHWDDVFEFIPGSIKYPGMEAVAHPDRASKANLVTSLKAENDDLMKRLAAAEKKSKALDKAYKTEKGINDKLRKEFGQKQDELRDNIKKLRNDMEAVGCVQQ